MEMRKVTSSNIEAIGYDPVTRGLAVAFKGSGRYLYDGVPPEIGDELLAIEERGGSVGRFFSAHVRDRFPCHKFPAA